MTYLFRYLKKYRTECVLAPLFKLCEALLELLVPLIVAAIVDNGIYGENTGYIVKAALIMAGLALAGLGLSVTAQYFSAKASVGFAGAVRGALYEKIQTFTNAQLDKAGVSTLITRATGDIEQVQTAVNLTLRLVLRSPFVVFGAAIMAFTVNARAALVFAVLIPVLSLIVFGIMLFCLPLYTRVRRSLDRVLGKTRETLSGVRVIRAFGGESREIAGFDIENGRLARAQLLVGRIGAVMDPAAFFVVNAGIFALLHFGAINVDSGDMSRGEVIALYNYMTQILVELVKLANLIITVAKGAACGKRISAVLQSESGEPAPEAGAVCSGETAIEFKNVSFKYENAAAESLENISFSLKTGETLGIIGGTGSGKSTLAALIPRFYRATGGEVLFFGENVNSLPRGEITRRVGYVPQKPLLFSGTVRSNLLWRDENASDEELCRALETAQALEVANEKGGLDGAVEQGGRNFSGGQRQRLTIARALVGDPAILILDDSASALDFATEASLRRALARGADTRATVIISQRTASIAHADRILVLDDGKAVGLGRHEELLKDCAVYREIYDSQFKKEAAE